MSASDALEAGILDLLFNAVAIPNIADDAASGPLTDLYVALHTADPAESGSQNNNETAYTGYQRIAVPRGGSVGFTRTGNQVVNTDVILFDEVTGAPGADIIYFSIGSLASGAGVIYLIGTISALPLSIGVKPRFSAGQLICDCN